jgi:hypothetical protein
MTSNVAKLDGSWQIKEQSIDIGKLKSNFLNGSNWAINSDSNTKKTITTIPDPIADEDVSNKKYVDSAISNINPQPYNIFYDYQTLGHGITGVLNGINKIFILDHSPAVNSLNIFINGLLQDNATYTLITNTITFNQNVELTAEDLLVINYYTISEAI